MRHTNGVKIVVVWKVRLNVEMGGAIGLCNRGRGVVGVIGGNRELEHGPFVVNPGRITVRVNASAMHGVAGDKGEALRLAVIRTTKATM